MSVSEIKKPQRFQVIGLTEVLLGIQQKNTFVAGGSDNAAHYALEEQILPPSDTSDYREMVLELYERVSGRPYDPVSTELAEIDLQNNDTTAFPWSSRDAATASMYFHMLADTLRCFRGMSPGMSVLEFGPGWGETTLALARLGFNITCVEINPSFVKLIQQKAAAAKLANIQCIVGEFLIATKIDDKFDAILFFECFHHAFRHDLLLDRCLEMLTPNGVIIFAGEPVMDNFPIPWGVRLDSQSLFCIAQKGWMELGFNSTYFRSLLTKRGLVAIEQNLPQYNFFRTYIASPCLRIDFTTAPLASQIGIRSGTVVRSNGMAGVLVYGPYWRLERGHYILRCDYTISCREASGEHALLRLAANIGEVTLGLCRLSGVENELEFIIGHDVDNIEFVISVPADVDFEFRAFFLRCRGTP